MDDKYCDSCLTAAYDEGADTHEEQVAVLDAMARDLPDHECDALEEEGITCACSAHSRVRAY